VSPTFLQDYAPFFSHLDVEQFLVPSSSATEARVFRLVLPDCDMLDIGKAT